MINKLLDKLPDLYNKTEGSNIYKLIKLAADQLAAGESTLQLIHDWRDIDQAQGRTLDKLGKDVGQVRGGSDDEAYRQKIKTKIRSNLSGGEIETLNSICIILVGNRFDGIQEGWTLAETHPIGPKPAMMLFTVIADGVHYGIPMAEIDEISGGGVAANWEVVFKSHVDISQTQYQRWSGDYLLASTTTMPTTEQQQGPINVGNIEAQTQYFASMHSMSMVGTLKAGEGIIL